MLQEKFANPRIFARRHQGSLHGRRLDRGLDARDDKFRMSVAKEMHSDSADEVHLHRAIEHFHVRARTAAVGHHGVNERSAAQAAQFGDSGVRFRNLSGIRGSDGVAALSSSKEVLGEVENSSRQHMGAAYRRA